MHRFNLFALIALGAACGDPCPSDMVSSARGCVDAIEPTWDDIYSTMVVPTCAIEFCHGDPEDMNEADLDLRGIDAAFARLDDVSASEDCASTGLRLVEPGEPEQSLFYLKLFRTAGEDEAICGFRMPYAGDPVADQWRDAVRTWIEDGAPRGAR